METNETETISGRTPVNEERTLHGTYLVGSELGSGGFGTVYAAKRRSDQLQVAVKYIPKRLVSRLVRVDPERYPPGMEVVVPPGTEVPREVDLLLRVSEVPGVIRLVDYLQDADYYYLVMESVDNCSDLYDFIGNRGRLTDREAKHIFRQVYEAITQCYNLGVVHRDIKDENILINTQSLLVKVIDFGSGAVLQDIQYTDFSGTRCYAPPEWFGARSYGAESITVWGLGMLLYDLVRGDIPFQTVKQVQRALLRFDPADNVSDGCQDLITKCLTANPAERATLEQMRQHPWLRSDY